MCIGASNMSSSRMHPLLISTRQLVGRSNQLLAELLELHLTALVMLAPHLTEENHRELLAFAKHRTKREILRIVRALAPEPTVPDRVEPLRPELIGITMPRAPSWRSFVESLGSAVRELPAGDRPKDWTDRASAAPELGCDAQVAATERVEEAPPALPQIERYKVQFTASQEYVDLLEHARDLLSHAVPNRSLEEVHLRALRLLVERLEKRKYGAPRSKPAVEDAQTQHRVQQSKNHTHATRRRVGSAAVRREVRDRDGTRCTFVDDSGQRCRETRFLESHHLLAHGRGGPPSTDNLTLRCQAHNALAAEHDFGREFIQRRVEEAVAQRGIAARPPP